MRCDPQRMPLFSSFECFVEVRSAVPHPFSSTPRAEGRRRRKRGAVAGRAPHPTFFVDTFRWMVCSGTTGGQSVVAVQHIRRGVREGGCTRALLAAAPPFPSTPSLSHLFGFCRGGRRWIAPRAQPGQPSRHIRCRKRGTSPALSSADRYSPGRPAAVGLDSVHSGPHKMSHGRCLRCRAALPPPSLLEGLGRR